MSGYHDWKASGCGCLVLLTVVLSTLVIAALRLGGISLPVLP